MCVYVMGEGGGGTLIFSNIHKAWTIFWFKILKFNILIFFGRGGGGFRKNE